MKIYKVSITETLSRLIEIEAPDKASALVEANRRWKDEGEVLNSDDFQGVDFQIEDV